ncbi:hypothetical protein SLS61_008844 [Didymella pomorum]
MPRGSVSQVLRVGTMIEGLKMHITDVQFTIPEGSNSWWPTFAGITKNSTLDDRKKVFPFEVSPAISGGRVGEVGLTSLSVFDSGVGPTACIAFILSGEILINGKKTLVGQKGTINISTNEWGGFWSLYGNADKIFLAYNLVDSIPFNCLVDIPVSGHTKELITAIGLDKDQPGDRLGIKVVPEENFAFDAANFLLGGVYYAHEAAYGWAFGAIGGWPAAIGYVAGDGAKDLASKYLG